MLPSGQEKERHLSVFLSVRYERACLLERVNRLKERISEVRSDSSYEVLFDAIELAIFSSVAGLGM